MKLIKNVTAVLLIIVSFMLAGCNNKADPKTSSKEKEKEKYNFSTAILSYKTESNKSKIYSLEDGKKTLIYEFDNLMDMKYSKDNNTFVMRKYIESGEELIHNKLTINFKGRETTLNDFYSVEDFKLSKDGTKIAFTSYSADELQSINDLKIYDIENDKYISFKPEVLISGQQYIFDEDDNLIYYGVDKKNNKNAVFSFNPKSLEQKEIYKLESGIINSIYCLKDSLIFLKVDLNENQLIEVKKGTNKEIVLSKKFEDICGLVDDEFIYFIGKEANNKPALYKIEEKKIKRLTYDFPQNVSTINSISRDDNGNIYILGYSEDSNVRELFQIKKDNSIILIDDKLKLINLYFSE